MKGWFGRFGLALALLADFAGDRMANWRSPGFAITALALMAGGIIFILYWNNE